MMLLGWAVHGQTATPPLRPADQVSPPATTELASHDASPESPEEASEVRADDMTAQQAAYHAQDQFGGRVLSVKLEDGDDGPYYQVKLLKHGQVRVVRINTRH